MQNINEYIRNLSINDKKTLSQKTLKLTEEVGELAKAILPYDSAHGTNHRFVDKEKILEEIVDVYLTNISIAYSLGINEEEFNDMLYLKSKKWNLLQLKEDKATFPLPFEIHVTIELEDLTDEIINKFRDDCASIEVKPIILDLEINESSSIKDVMTSSKFFGDNRGSYEETDRICKALKSKGYTVVRKKIETVPWHPAAPLEDTGEPIPNNCYFESHIGVVITPNQKEDLNSFVNGLNEGCTEVGRTELGGTCKLSQNFFKRSKDGSKYVNMLTYRDRMTTYKTFEEDVESIKRSLVGCGFAFEKVEVEYAIYDSNVTHDALWIQ